MQKYIFAGLVLVISTFSCKSHCVDYINISLGNITRPSNESDSLNSLGVGAYWNTDLLKKETVNYSRTLRIESGFGLNQTNFGAVKDIYVSPVIHYQFTNTHPVFLEVGIGFTYISQTRWKIYHDNRSNIYYDLGSHLLFADRIGIGYKYRKSEISLNVYHISSANLRTPNPGADMIFIRTNFEI